ncbi:MAG: hypothetical protein JJ964_11915 [Rhizobiales bacterium]|nr:hypothetical protein [Hyphomicrobiales bacterium]
MSQQKIVAQKNAFVHLFQETTSLIGIISLACTLFGGLEPLITVSKWAKILIENWNLWTLWFWKFLFSWLYIDVSQLYASCLNLVACGVVLLLGPILRYLILNRDMDELFNTDPKSYSAFYMILGPLSGLFSIYTLLTPGLSYLWNNFVHELHSWGFVLFIVILPCMLAFIAFFIILSFALPFFSKGLVKAVFLCGGLIVLNYATVYLDSLQKFLTIS